MRSAISRRRDLDRRSPAAKPLTSVASKHAMLCRPLRSAGISATTYAGRERFFSLMRMPSSKTTNLDHASGQRGFSSPPSPPNGKCCPGPLHVVGISVTTYPGREDFSRQCRWPTFRRRGNLATTPGQQQFSPRSPLTPASRSESRCEPNLGQQLIRAAKGFSCWRQCRRRMPGISMYTSPAAKLLGFVTSERRSNAQP